MGSIDRRIVALERRLASEGGRELGGRSEAAVKLTAVINEIGALRSSCARHFRGGVAIEPENIPRKILGPGYTRGDLVRLAAERASEAGAFPEEEIPRWTATVFALSKRDNYDEVVEKERAHGV